MCGTACSMQSDSELRQTIMCITNCSYSTMATCSCKSLVIYAPMSVVFDVITALLLLISNTCLNAPAENEITYLQRWMVFQKIAFQTALFSQNHLFKWNGYESSYLLFMTLQQYSGFDLWTAMRMVLCRCTIGLFVECEENPADAPLLLWFNGGPGALSLYGLLVELGPFWWAWLLLAF